ncbi:hypothetical protein DN748_01120 [Sinomicrobium soli]|nr:hypothetical protein DN748_01120 [Sinomicrobium sp. N-1-3-6]
MTVGVYAQDGFESIIAAGEKDANTLMGAYIAPAMEGLVYAANGGWATTAKTHKTLGFDITIAANAAMVPRSNRLFRISELAFENRITGTPDMTPTVAGDAEPSMVEVELRDTGETVSFTMPEGIGEDVPMNAIPAPAVQLGVGIVKNTDLMLRFVPRVGSDDVRGQLFGLGIKHDLMQYFGPLEKLPLNVSVLAAFSNMKVDYNIEEGDAFDGEHQSAEFKLGTYTIQGLASLDFPFVTVFGSLGYSGGTSRLDVLGTYEVDYEVAGVYTHTEEYEDPIALKYNVGGVRAGLGARLNLAFFKIFAEYTLQEYNMLTAGIAFSFR